MTFDLPVNRRFVSFVLAVFGRGLISVFDSHFFGTCNAVEGFGVMGKVGLLARDGSDDATVFFSTMFIRFSLASPAAIRTSVKYVLRKSTFLAVKLVLAFIWIFCQQLDRFVNAWFQ